MKKVGIIGAGSFGTAIANILSENNEVLIYARRQEIVDAINTERNHKNQTIHPNIKATNNLEEIANECDLIFPLVPSSKFKNMLGENYFGVS